MSEEIDYEFLKGKPWDTFKMGFEQLSDLLDKEILDIRELETDLDEDDLVEEAKDNLLLTLQRMRKGGNVMGKGVWYGVTAPNDYVGTWKRVQINAYKKLSKGEGPVYIDNVKYSTMGEMIDSRLIKIDNVDGEKVIVALDKRDVYKTSGAVNPDRGKPYEESTYMSNVVGYWECSLDNKKRTVHPVIGGQGDDSDVNPTCPTCNEPCWTKECSRVTTVNKKKVKCDGVKDNYILEDIMKHSGELLDFPLKLTVDKGVIIKIEWSGDTKGSITSGKKLTLKETIVKEKGEIVRDSSGRAKRKLKGSMLNWIPKDCMITSKKVTDAWLKDRVMLRKIAKALWKDFGRQPVFYHCSIYQISGPRYGNYTFQCSDNTTTSNEEDDGLEVQVPEYLYDLVFKDKIGKNSRGVFVGIMARKQEKDLKTKKLKYEMIADKKGKKQKVQVFTKPFIGASFFVPTKIVIPKVTEKDKMKVGSLENDKPIVVKDEPLPDEDDVVETTSTAEIIEPESAPASIEDDFEDADDVIVGEIDDVYDGEQDTETADDIKKWNIVEDD